MAGLFLLFYEPQFVSIGPPPHYVSMFLVLKISKNWHFLTLPPTNSYVIYEWSLYKVIEIILFFYLAATDDFDEQGVDWL